MSSLIFTYSEDEFIKELSTKYPFDDIVFRTSDGGNYTMALLFNGTGGTMLVGVLNNRTEEGKIFTRVVNRE